MLNRVLMPLQEISLHKMANFRLSSKEEVVQAQQAAIQHPKRSGQPMQRNHLNGLALGQGPRL